MKFTGERVIPGQGDPDLYNEHRARYLFAQQFCPGKTVLDAACGTGYGSAILGEKARAVFGIDLSQEAIEYAQGHYRSAGVHFGRSDCRQLPFPSGQFDVAVAFEIIEHLQDPEAFLAELRRVLGSSGLLVLSTPNRLYYTEERGEINPFHCREFSYPEFEGILRPVFPHCSILFENHVAGLAVTGPGTQAALGEPEVQKEDSAAAAKEGSERGAHYFVALCSAHPLPRARPLLYLPATANVLREREGHIRRLTEQLREMDAKVEWALGLEKELGKARLILETLQQQFEDRTRWVQTLEQELDGSRAALEQLQQQFQERTRWAQDLDRQVSEKDAYIQQLQADYDAKVAWALSLEQELDAARAALNQLQAEFEERTAWALRLEQELNQSQKELEDRREDLRLLYGSLWYRAGKNLGLSPIPASDRTKHQSGNV